VPTRVFVLCLDGFGPLYLAQSDMPNLRQIAAQGFQVTGHSLLPSVTNVNTVSLVTGTFPREHGVTGNAYYDPGERVGGLMESARFVQMPTIFERARCAGWHTALVTAKVKLLELLGKGADVAISAECPSAALCTSIGTPASIYSLAVNYWVLTASRELIRREGPELVYAFTTDYAMHKYPPEDECSQAHLRQLDALLGEILGSVSSDVALFVTADHGMSAKSIAIDLEKWLSNQGIAATVVSTIRDQYTAHHRNLSGSAHVYCTRPDDVAQAAELLRVHPAVEEVWPRAEAAAAFHLLPERIGDLMVLARSNALFGELTEAESEVTLRSHGSRHESQVPIIGTKTLAYHPYQYNLDVTRAVRQFFF
jgi:phosphonoacetate hydrolase